jgi:NAD(P)-dependent dehydrogenase (short-subunit alcohol dehydrogenase family)
VSAHSVPGCGANFPREESAISGQLEGKVAVVTGAGSGIGLAAAERFHAEGASVVAADVSGQEEDLAARLGDGCVPAHADVSQAEQVEAMIAIAMSTFGRLDVLYNNAGIDGEVHPTSEYPEEVWDRVMAVNLRGVFLGIRYGIPAMLSTGGGSIINTASMAAKVGFPNLSAYCASKGGVVILTKTVAVEYATQGIRVNAICPGNILTPIYDDLPKEMVEGIKSKTPIGRFADPSEVASLALFLASDESRFITGTELLIDGGYTAL